MEILTFDPFIINKAFSSRQLELSGFFLPIRAHLGY